MINRSLSDVANRKIAQEMGSLFPEEPALVFGGAQMFDSTALYMEYAAKKLKGAGFVLCATSMKSEACYYQHHSSKKMLRIAAHRKSRTEIKYGVGKNTVSGITFTPQFNPKSKEAVDKIIYLAVGKYFMAKEPE